MSQHSFATSLRRRIAIVMAAMLAITLVPLAGPAGAQPAAAPDITAACENAGDAGFNDIAGTGFEDEINCLAAFGVTVGTTATTYSPAVQVRRSQMALFYYRIGVAAGLTWDTSAAGFTDLGGLDQPFVDAINALANAGIVQGTSATEFSPQDRIRRSQMALFIDRFQEFAFNFAYSDGFVGDDLFPDISALDAEARLAVNGIGSVGITQGDAAGNYVPSGFVSRQQMSAFIVRHLAENGFEVPGEAVSGVIIDTAFGGAGATNGYIISTGSAIVEVEPGDDPTFMLNGIPATPAVFGGVVELGALITYNEDEDTHDATPQSDAQIRAAGYTVGPMLHVVDWDDAAPSAATNLIELYSGQDLTGSINLLDDTGDDSPVYRIGNATVTPAQFFATISMGDTLSITGWDDTDETTVYRLVTGEITGGGDFDGVGGAQIDIQLDRTGWIEYTTGAQGNNLAGVNEFQLTDALYQAGAQRYTAEGAPFTYNGINAWIGDALADADTEFVRVTYSRSNGVEQFVFTAVEEDEAPAPEPGSISGTFVGGSVEAIVDGISFEILVNGDLYEVDLIQGDAGLLVDGVITAAAELLDPANQPDAGASVTILVENSAQIDHDDNEIEASQDGDLVLITNP